MARFPLPLRRSMINIFSAWTAIQHSADASTHTRQNTQKSISNFVSLTVPFSEGRNVGKWICHAIGRTCFAREAQRVLAYYCGPPPPLEDKQPCRKRSGTLPFRACAGKCGCGSKVGKEGAGAHKKHKRWEHTRLEIIAWGAARRCDPL